MPEPIGHLTCYAYTHLKGPGWMSVCHQVSNAVATDDESAVTCDLCLRPPGTLPGLGSDERPYDRGREES